jgi:hypothetical protein
MGGTMNNEFKCVCCGTLTLKQNKVKDLDEVCLDCEDEVRFELSQPVDHWLIDEEYSYDN